MFDGFCGGCLARSQLRWLRVRPEHALQPLKVVTCSDLVTGRHARRNLHWSTTLPQLPFAHAG